MNDQNGRFIRIEMPRCTLIFTQQELQHLLARNPDLWTVALKRGKAILRREKADSRSRTQ